MMVVKVVVMASKEENILINELRKQSPEAIKQWLHGNASMVDVVVKYKSAIKMVLAIKPELRKQIEELNYDRIVKNVCEVYPELRKTFEEKKVREKVEGELATIKRIILS